MPAKKKRSNKAKATKVLQKKNVWTDGALWVVKQGKLKPSRGRPQKESPLFKAVAEKLPFDALTSVSSALQSHGIAGTGVYIAHDSMGNARYIGRGNIFARLAARKKAQPLELTYFSFYIIEAKRHEREIETILIRAAGPHLMFNERKKRVDILPGDIKDFEAGTRFFERQRKKGRARKKSAA